MTDDSGRIEDPITHEEAASLLGVSYRTLRRLLKAGKIKHGYRIPGSPTSGLMVSRSSVLAFRDEREANAYTAVAAGKPNPDFEDLAEKLQAEADRVANAANPDERLAEMLRQIVETIYRVNAQSANQQKEKPDNEPAPAPKPKRKRKT